MVADGSGAKDGDTAPGVVIHTEYKDGEVEEAMGEGNYYFDSVGYHHPDGGTKS